MLLAEAVALFGCRGRADDVPEDAGAADAPADDASQDGGPLEVTELPAPDGGCAPWPLAGLASSVMRPGHPCLECHDRPSGSAPAFAVAGTVFDALHAEDDCEGVEGVRVRLVGAAGRRVELTTNPAGNFYTTQELELPLSVALLAGGRVRRMEREVEQGDCNRCHSAAGAQEAPGRIVTPALP